MKKRHFPWRVLLEFVAFGASGATGTAQQSGSGTAQPITLPNTYRHVLRSRVNGRVYLIDVALPSAYFNAKPGDLTRYPTLYLLENDASGFLLLFAHMQPDVLFGTRLRLGPTRPILIGVVPADNQSQRRGGFDLTPPLTSADSEYFKGKSLPPVGGAPQFLRALKEEIIPFIDSSYRTSGDRGIEGWSFGGLFVAYAMLQEPDLFTRYAMISPSLWYPWGRDKGIILAREPDFAKQHPTFQKTVYVSVGSEEVGAMSAVAMQFVEQLCGSMSKGYYKGLDLGAEILPGESHGSPASRVRVLAALYSADSAAVKPGRALMQSCR